MKSTGSRVSAIPSLAPSFPLALPVSILCSLHLVRLKKKATCTKSLCTANQVRAILLDLQVLHLPEGTVVLRLREELRAECGLRRKRVRKLDGINALLLALLAQSCIPS